MTKTPDKKAVKTVVAPDPHPGIEADPARNHPDHARAQTSLDHAPANHPQADRDNRSRERINQPDSHKGRTPTNDRKRDDRTPKHH